MDADVLQLANRVLDISFKKNMSHLGSVFSSLPIVWDIYRKKKEEDKFVLSNGHAGLALYVVLEKIYGINAEDLLDQYGIHPVRSRYIDCSTGSLGLGLPIAAGMALGSPYKIYCIISDGECCEGSVWEALRFIEDFKIDISIYVDMNGLSAYDTVDKEILKNRLRAFHPAIEICETPLKQFDFISGLEYHYKVLNEEEYYTMRTSGVYA